MINTSKIRFHLFFFYLVLQISVVRAQSAWPSENWASAINLTGIMNPAGLTELSGLHWNPVNNRLYVIDDKGMLRILQLNTETDTFMQIADKSISGGPEGITQADFNANEFYTVDENNYEIRRFTHTSNFSTITFANHWNLLAPPSPMLNTGNTGPEGIAFIPDSFLISAGFISQATGQSYTSVKGMGGLIFIAHQDQGYIWVFDVNPETNDDFAYVGKYKTNRDESCDLDFDRSTGLLYILHNTGNNYLEVTNLSSVIVPEGRKFTVVNEYKIPNPTGNTNIEGFAMIPRCSDSSNVSAWLCRDVSSKESFDDQKDCIRWFQPFSAAGNCTINTGLNDTRQNKFSIKTYPNPANEILSFSETVENIEIFNLLGEREMFKYGSANYILTSMLSNGIYLLRCNKGTARFIVAH